LKKAASYKDYTSICNSVPSEFLSIVGLQNKEKLIARNLEIIRHNMTLLRSFFEKYDKYFEWVEPNNGPIAFPRLVVNVTAEAFCQDLIEKKGVLLLPR
jgi:aspartate/methionine/tyrosine aminotransferase